MLSEGKVNHRGQVSQPRERSVVPFTLDPHLRLAVAERQQDDMRIKAEVNHLIDTLFRVVPKVP